MKHKWYLPHHPVLNPSKPGKVRRVCNAGAKFQGSSLNSHLLSGPDLMNNLVRQRIKLPFVFCGVNHLDLEQKCAPTCSLNYVLLRSAEENRLQFPTAALAVKQNFYMDDFFKSVESSSEALELQQQLVAMLKLAGFNLTKWISNEKEKNERIPVSERAPSVKVVEVGMVRVGGWIERANIPYSGRHPLVLSPEHELSRLIVINRLQAVPFWIVERSREIAEREKTGANERRGAWGEA